MQTMSHVPTIIVYVDPSAGSLLMQLVLGGVAGILVVFRVVASRFKQALSTWILRLRGKS